MNKRKYRDELLRLREVDGKRIEGFAKLFEHIFELLASKLEPIRPMMPIDINPMEVDVKRNMEIEELAQEYHEICREMIERQIGLITKPTRPYIEWKDLTEEQKDGRRFIAENLLKIFNITEK